MNGQFGFDFDVSNGTIIVSAPTATIDNNPQIGIVYYSNMSNALSSPKLSIESIITKKRIGSQEFARFGTVCRFYKDKIIVTEPNYYFESGIVHIIDEKKNINSNCFKSMDFKSLFGRNTNMLNFNNKEVIIITSPRSSSFGDNSGMVNILFA